MLNMIFKRIKASCRNLIVEETHMKEKHETKKDELVFKVHDFIGSSTKVKKACYQNIGG